MSANNLRQFKTLDEAQDSFIGGNQVALIDAMALCNDLNLPHPQWVKDGFRVNSLALSRTLRGPRYELPGRFDSELASLINQARAGKAPHIADTLLARFVNAVESGEMPDPKLMRYLSDAFGEMLDSGSRDPRKPLGLRRSIAGNPGDHSRKRPMTVDDKIEFQQQVVELYAAGLTQAQICAKLEGVVVVPAVPARLLGKDSVRDMVRRVTHHVPESRQRLVAEGADAYDLPRLLASEYDVEVAVMERVLHRLASRGALAPP